MRGGLKLVMLTFVFALLATTAAHAQSSMYFNYLPQGFVPGGGIMKNDLQSLQLPGDAQPNGSNSMNAKDLLTPPSTHKNWEFDYSLILLGVDQQSQFESYQILSFRIYSTFKYKVSDDIVLWFEPYLIFRAGSDQSTDGNGHTGTLVIPKDASLIWTPLTWWQFRTGILDQNFVHTFMLLEDQAFPGARSTVYLGNSDLRGSLLLEEDVLTYSSNTTNTNQIEATPTLETAMLQAHYKFDRRDQLKLSAGYWEYDNLPSSVAALAMLNGNTVERVSDTYSQFAYQFHGVELRSRLELGLGPVDWNLYAEGLVNTAAPTGLNTGWSAGNEFLLHSSGNKKFGLNFEYFHVEPDAAVSAFNAIEFDRSNRNGVMILPYFKWGKHQNKLSLRYVDSSLIYNNPAQSDATQVRIRWETDYEAL